MCNKYSTQRRKDAKKQKKRIREKRTKEDLGKAYFFAPLHLCAFALNLLHILLERKNNNSGYAPQRCFASIKPCRSIKRFAMVVLLTPNENFDHGYSFRTLFALCQNRHPVK
jgi:hypothetical protein